MRIKSKDGLERTGVLGSQGIVWVKTPASHGSNPTLENRQLMSGPGSEIVITNSYIIYRNPELREKALRDGVHKLINFKGPVVTDSGSFQLSEYGEIDVTNDEIVMFQDEIGTDIGTSLDIPTPPG